MVRIELPESKFKRARRRRRVVLLGLFVFGALFLVGGVAGLTHLPHWRVVSIEVSGVEGTEAEAVKKIVREQLAGSYFYIFPRNNVALYPRDAIKEGLFSEFPTFASVELGATNLRAVGIDIVKRTPHALWCGEVRTTPTPCLLLDQAGVAYEASAQFGGAVYTTYYGTLAEGSLPRQYLSEESFRSLVALVAALEENQDTHIVSVEVDKTGDSRLRFAGGFELIFTLEDGGGDVFERFTLALTAEPFKDHTLGDFEYLDLRFGDRLYYKLK